MRVCERRLGILCREEGQRSLDEELVERGGRKEGRGERGRRREREKRKQYVSAQAIIKGWTAQTGVYIS